MKHLRAVHKYFWKYRFRFFAGILFVVLSNYLAILAPQITAYVVNKVQALLPGAKATANLRQVDPLVNTFINWAEGLQWGFEGIVALCGMTILVLAMVRGVFMFLMRQTTIVMSRHIEYDQKNEVFAHFLKMDANFFKSRPTGDLMSRIAEDVSRVRMYTGPAIMYLTNLTTIIVFAVYNMLAKNVQLTLFVLAPLPLLAITIYYVNTIIHRRSEKIQEALGELTTQAQQAYSGIRVIKSYVQEKAMLGFFDSQSRQYRDQAIGLARVEAIYFPSMTLLIGLSTLIAIMAGGMFYLNGTITDVGTIVEFVLYITMLTFPVSAIGWVASMIQRAAASQKRLNELLQEQPVIIAPANATGPQASAPWAVELEAVHFTYAHTGIQALKGLSLRIGKGQKVAIIGRTGSGKSTIAHLLMRQYDVQQGAVRIQGTDVQHYDPERLRATISVVPQEVFLFSDTVANNIRFGKPEASLAEVEEAATQAVVAGEIARFDQQYDTLVGERGVTLSGGQKQRVSIARALLKPADIIVFDDCLSAVDARTEKAVLEQLEKALRGKTAIIITHRIFSLLAFDQIVVMDEGRIIEQGTHEELLALGGEYAGVYQRQMDDGSRDKEEESEP